MPSDRLREALRAEQLLHEKVAKAVREFPIGHDHWDRTMHHGAGCELCIKQLEAKNALMELMTSSPAALTEQPDATAPAEKAITGLCAEGYHNHCGKPKECQCPCHKSRELPPAAPPAQVSEEQVRQCEEAADLEMCKRAPKIGQPRKLRYDAHQERRKIFTENLNALLRSPASTKPSDAEENLADYLLRTQPPDWDYATVLRLAKAVANGASTSGKETL